MDVAGWVSISVASSALLAVLALGRYLARRTEGQARSNRAARAVNVAAVRYLYELDIWAAGRGIELPPRPRELTRDYLEDRARSL